MKDYTDCGKHCDTAYDTLIQPIKLLQDLMADFNDFYNSEQAKVVEESRAVAERLTVWVDLAEGCLTRPDNPVSVFPSTTTTYRPRG